MARLLLPLFYVALVGSFVSCAPVAATLSEPGPSYESAQETKATEVESEVKIITEADAPKTYWATQLNLPVLDKNGTQVNTLWLRQSVEVFEIKEQRGRIDPVADVWVDLTDFTTTKPETPLVQPGYTSRPPKIVLPQPDP